MLVYKLKIFVAMCSLVMSPFSRDLLVLCILFATFYVMAGVLAVQTVCNRSERPFEISGMKNKILSGDNDKRD